MTTSLNKAKDWAGRLWAESAALWAERSVQDDNYRRYVVEPVLLRQMKQVGLNSSSKIIEIGCGDGSHVVFLRGELGKMGLNSVHIVGIDNNESLIRKAKEKASSVNNARFEVGDATSVEATAEIMKSTGQVDLVIAMFLLQDTPDLEGVLTVVQAILKKGGHFIALVVHPNFAERLDDTGHLKRYGGTDLPLFYMSNSGLVQWRYIGYYPILKADGPPFYLPYFHRTVADYRDAFIKKKFDVAAEISLIPDCGISGKWREAKIEPFYESLWNVYWPYILKEPSSILIHAVNGRGATIGC